MKQLDEYQIKDQQDALNLLEAITIMCEVLAMKIHDYTPEIREVCKKLQSTIGKWELDVIVFKQPMSKLEEEYRKDVEEQIERFRKSNKKIIL